MTDFTTRSVNEARTLELLEQATAGDRWNPTRAALAMTWRACWSQALRLDLVVRTTVALAAYSEETAKSEIFRAAIQAELTKLVREKVLRSWTRGKDRFYEVNF